MSEEINHDRRRLLGCLKSLKAGLREAISLSPWLQPGETGAYFQGLTVSRFPGIRKPLKRLGGSCMAFDHRAEAAVLMRSLRESKPTLNTGWCRCFL